MNDARPLLPLVACLLCALSAGAAEMPELAAPPDVGAAPAELPRTESGIAWRVLRPGTGKQHPGPVDGALTHYTGWTPEGELFESSVAIGKPEILRVDRVIPGVREMLVAMVEGEKRRVWIPAPLAFGSVPSRPPGAVVYDLELLEIVRAPAAPPDVAAPPPEAEKRVSGLATRRLRAGTGKDHPGPDDAVIVHYDGWLADGRLWDSSRFLGRPGTMPLLSAYPMWKEAAQLLVKGEKRRFWFPAGEAFKGQANAPEGPMVYDVELIDFRRAPKPPEDLGAIPPGAEKTASGLITLVLRKGTGQEHPRPTSKVTMHYSGWSLEGKLFDSTALRGEPATLEASSLAPGWIEGLGLMVAGEKRRLWIPETLGFGEHSGAPKGTLVLDVELLSFRD